MFKTENFKDSHFCDLIVFLSVRNVLWAETGVGNINLPVSMLDCMDFSSESADTHVSKESTCLYTICMQDWNDMRERNIQTKIYSNMKIEYTILTWFLQ